MNGEGVGRLFSSSMVDGPARRALRAGGVADHQPAPSRGVGVAGRLPVRQGGGAAEPLRHGEGLPVRRHQLPAHRARALRHPARAPARRAPARAVRRAVPGSSPRRRGSGPATGCGSRRCAAGSRCSRSSPRGSSRSPSTARPSTRWAIPIHWGFVGIAADNDPRHGANWLANALTPFVGDANARTPEFKAFLVNVERI